MTDRSKKCKWRNFFFNLRVCMLLKSAVMTSLKFIVFHNDMFWVHMLCLNLILCLNFIFFCFGVW